MYNEKNYTRKKNLEISTLIHEAVHILQTMCQPVFSSAAFVKKLHDLAGKSIYSHYSAGACVDDPKLVLFIKRIPFFSSSEERLHGSARFISGDHALLWIYPSE